MNQIYKHFFRIIIFFSNCFFYASDQEKIYEILFSEKNSHGKIVPFIEPIMLAQGQVDQMQLIKDLIELQSGSQKINQSISVIVEDDSLKEAITKTFEHVYLPVVTEFIQIKDKEEDAYFKIIFFIAFIKNNYNDLNYELLKNILHMGEYLQAPLIVKRAFANVCYDLKPDYLTQKTNEALINVSYTNKSYKEVYKTFEKNEKDFIRNDLLISLNDLPKKFVKADDFINKGLRSLDGIKEIIQSEYNRYRARYVFYQKMFNFNENFIQDIDSLSVLTDQLERENIGQCRFIVNLRQQKLSEKAKEECEKINQFINKSSLFKDRFENVKESDLMPDPWMNVKMKISHFLQNPRTSFAGLFAYTGLYIFLTWQFHIFASNQIMYMEKQILSPSLFKKFEKIPLKALPLTLFMIRFTFRPYYNMGDIIEKILIFRFKQIVNPDELALLPTISLYILYDK